MKTAVRLILFVLLALTGSAAGIYKQQLIDEVLVLTDARGTLEAIRLQNVTLMKAALLKAAAETTDQIYMKRLKDRMLLKYEDHSKEQFAWSRWEPKLSDHYDQQYTDAQLKAYLAFLKTDAGRAMLRTQSAFPDSLLLELNEDRVRQEGRLKQIVSETIAEVDKEMVAANAKLATSTMSEVEEKARAGDPVAQKLMAAKYAEGQGVAKDPIEAIKWLRMAADQGDTDAMRQLGEAYLRGEWFEKDPPRAREFFTRGAEAGDYNCMYLLGWMYVRGEGGPKDAKAAFPLLLKAAKAGHPGAQEELAILYWNGNGVEKNPTEAYAWVVVMEGDDENGSGAFGKYIRKYLPMQVYADGGMRGVELKREIQAFRQKQK